MLASHSCGASTTIEGVPRVRSTATQVLYPRRHPRGERRTGQRGQQFRCRGPDVAAPVGERPLQERFVRRAQSGAQGVEEHQPVLGPLGRPGGGEQLARGPGVLGPYRGEQCDPLGEETLLPELLRAPGVLWAGQRGAAAGQRPQGEAPVRVQPREPQGARPGEGKGRGPQVRTAPGGVEERGQCFQGRRETSRVRQREPLRQQLHEVGRRAPAAAASRAGTVRQQCRESVGRGGRRARRGSGAAGSGRAAARAARTPARRRRVSTAAASSRATGASRPAAQAGGGRRSVPSRAIVTSSSQEPPTDAPAEAEVVFMSVLSVGRRC